MLPFHVTLDALHTDLFLVFLTILTIFHSTTWAMVSVKAGLAQVHKAVCSHSKDETEHELQPHHLNLTAHRAVQRGKKASFPSNTMASVLGMGHALFCGFVPN